MKKSIKKEFKDLTKRFTSLDKVAENLRPHPGFEKINRATIHRWIKQPSHRTELAIDILSSKSRPSKIRIAEPTSLLALPSMMLAWPPEAGKPHGRLKKTYSVDVEEISVPTGGEALAMLEAGNVDVALAAPSLAINYPNCQRVCSLTRAPVLGIARKRVVSIADLKGMRFGCPASSAIPQLLGELNRMLTLDLQPVEILPPDDSCIEYVKAFDENRIDCFVAWQPYIQKISAVRDNLVPIKDPLLGYIDIGVMVNIKGANPHAIKAYLECLQEAATYVEDRKKVDSFHSEIADQVRRNKMELSAKDVGSVLENSVFSTGDCDLATLLLLWTRSDGVYGPSEPTDQPS
jgi:ABC-type nitrate/sulfonate/bicarbonate transport system substrate-binding protein